MGTISVELSKKIQFSKLSNKSLNLIYGIERSKTKYDVVGISKFLRFIGNPQDNLKCIHIAGTNGKGSVCSMIANSLEMAGYNVGMYTSPHLMKVNERIQINKKHILDEDLDRLHDFIMQAQERYRVELSFFETITVLAFFYFFEKKVDYVVLETGLGGRFDATNVATPLISIITNIGDDHSEILGKTIEERAREKAGIIKNNIPTVTCAKDDALKVIQDICAKNDSRLILAEKYQGQLNLKGRYQKENAGVAYTALKYLNISEKHIIDGLRTAYWPGRFEFIRKNVLLDCAHNPDGMNVLMDSLKDIEYGRLIVIIGMMKDKNAEEMCKKIKDIANDVIITKVNIFKAQDPHILANYFDNCIITEDIGSALKFAKRIRTEKDLILITGSIYLIGDVMDVFRKGI